MSRVVACLPLNELLEGTKFLSENFPDAKTMLNHSRFDERVPESVSQILLFIEDSLGSNDTIFRLLACRGFNYLFFSKAANPNWKDTLTSGRLEIETDRFILWFQPDGTGIQRVQPGELEM